MDNRMVHLGNIRVNSVTYGSIFDIGDVEHCTPMTRAIAVQKEGGVRDDEGFEFENFDLFDRDAPQAPDMVTVNQQTYHHQPNIHVNNVDITGVSSSSVVQIGSLRTINAEARIKHFRILEDEDEQNENQTI